MARIWSETDFQVAFEKYVTGGRFLEKPEYYPRYQSRYRFLLRKFSKIAPTESVQVLDVGGGQLALLCKVLWNGHAVAVDIGGEHLDYLSESGVETRNWNLCNEPSPYENRFDYIFFSEVIEHLPIPGHLVLEKLRSALKENGVIICSTPNLYRPRNVIYLLFGKQIFDNFHYPTDHGLGHIIEYSDKHLSWQFARAGFTEAELEFVQMHHVPNKWFHKVLYFLGSIAFLLPRWRDNIVITSKK